MTKRHLHNKYNATHYLRKLATFSLPQEKFYYLRGLDPFIFEEMILTAYKKKNYRIIRNKQYTGDGGVDGHVFIDNKRYLIQAKRYKAHINAKHLQEFIALCKKRNVSGLFVHSGKTGPKSWDLVKGSGVLIVSGEKLLELLALPPEQLIRRKWLTRKANASFKKIKI